MRIIAKDLEKLLIKLFQGYGAGAAEAREISAHLVMSNLRGNDSHGVLRAPWYIEKIKKKEIVPGSRITVERETASSAVVNGHWGFGQPIARYAMELAIKKARSQVVSCVTVKNCNHVGRVGAYTSLASAKGMVGIGMANLHGTSHVVAPFGGIDRKLPTNPVSIALPSGYDPNFLLDMSSCMVSEGTLKFKFNRKERVPKGWIIDNEGKSTTDPKDFYLEPRGAILPLGGISGHKGFALSLAIDALSGALSGAQCSNRQAKRHGNACCFIVIKIAAFTSLRAFKKNVGKLRQHVKSSRCAQGTEDILMPGEPEKRRTVRMMKEGIDIDDMTWSQICENADALGLDISSFGGKRSSRKPRADAGL